MKNFQKTDVCLVNLPFANISYPSAALGILSACLTDKKINSKTFHVNLDFAKTIGLQIYNLLSDLPQELLIGEWVFSHAAFPEFASDDDEYFKRILNSQPRLKNSIIQIRNHVDRYLDNVVEEILSHEPKIIGCSSNFQQHCASLALLRRVKKINPNIHTVMGGSNCEGQAAKVIIKNFGWIDYVCFGEADASFPILCQELLNHDCQVNDVQIPKGFMGRKNFASEVLAGLPSRTFQFAGWDLVPQYDEYFLRLNNVKFHEKINPILVTESSRGCWWGQKVKCTFCGLEDETVKFREKNADTFCDEVERLSRKHNIKTFRLLDNSVSLATLEKMSERFADQGYYFFCDIKANLNKEMVKKISRAGIKGVQVGIESLSNDVLKLIHKGTSTLLNVQFLKWATHFGIESIWNFLVGFPKEKAGWYQTVLELIPKIRHLYPPTGYHPVKYYRFSDYFFKQEFYNLQLQAQDAYQYVYPIPISDLNDMAYYFKNVANESDINTPFRAPIYEKMKNLVENWIDGLQTENKPSLILNFEEGVGYVVMDSRENGKQKRIQISDFQRRILQLCDKVTGEKQLEDVFFNETENLHEALYFLEKNDLLLKEGDKLLGLINLSDTDPN